MTPQSKTANRLGAAFYATTALVALAGATTAAVDWLGWPLLPAAIAVAVVELGGIALTARADLRRRLGERAIAARALSVGVAGFAVAFQWLGHSDHRQGLFFAGVSALAYTTWLINSADRRRDALRAAGQLPPPAPVYGVVQWVRHPWLTRRARRLALQDPSLGLYGSLGAARDQVRAEARQRALAALLRRRLSEGRDPLGAEIAVAVYDLDEIALRLAASADYEALTALLAADVAPAVVTAPATSVANTPASDTATEAAKPRPRRRPIDRPTKTNGTAEKVAKVAARKPDATAATIAAAVGISERSARRYLAAIRAANGTATTTATERVNGIPVEVPA